MQLKDSQHYDFTIRSKTTCKRKRNRSTYTTTVLDVLGSMGF